MENYYKDELWTKYYGPDNQEDSFTSFKSVGDLFDDTSNKWAKNTAIVFYGNKISYKKLQEKVNCLSNALSDLGIKKGDRIAFLLLNSPEYIISFYAAVKIGAIITPISPVYVSNEIHHQLSDSGADSIICQDILYEAVEKTGIKLKNVILTSISDSLPKIKKLVGKSILRSVYQKMAAPSPEIVKKEGFHQLSELIKNYPASSPNVEINAKEDIMVLPYTGGTTGRPKGVMLTHLNSMINLDQVRLSLPILNNGKETIVSYMPYYHAAGQSFGVVMAILLGYKQIVITTPETDDILNSVIKYNATMFLGAPTMYEILKDYEKTDRVKWKKLKVLFSGADALNEFTAKDWEERTGSKITEGYGMTETTATVTMNPIGKQKYGSIGIPLPGTKLAILDVEEDNFIPINEMGEIVVNGPQITKGYWQNEDATKECEALIDGVKWWRTGDLGRMEENGYFYTYDRKRDLIKYKGLRVFAREVEEVLKMHQNIKEVGVVGERDTKVGENVKAVIVLESDARGKINETDIKEYCKDKLSHYKIPKIIEFVGEIAKTDIGKVSRREIREQDNL